jgi:carbon storage regulator
MLILSRRPGDAILIDGGIRIVVLASGQRSVRLGIEAPSDVGIVREEIASRGPDGQILPSGSVARKANGANGVSHAPLNVNAPPNVNPPPEELEAPPPAE